MHFVKHLEVKHEEYGVVAFGAAVTQASAGIAYGTSNGAVDVNSSFFHSRRERRATSSPGHPWWRMPYTCFGYL
jgi:hypothetical protein